MAISNEQLEELCAKLAALELSDDQRLLLDNVMKIAWDFVSSHGDLNAQFDGCFEPGEAAAIMAYHEVPPTTYTSKSIDRGSGMSSINLTIQP